MKEMDSTRYWPGGHKKKAPYKPKKQITEGYQHGYLTVIKVLTQYSPYKYRVKCSCGASRILSYYPLVNPRSESCGCYGRYKMDYRRRARTEKSHGREMYDYPFVPEKYYKEELDDPEDEPLKYDTQKRTSHFADLTKEAQSRGISYGQLQAERLAMKIWGKCE